VGIGTNSPVSKLTVTTGTDTVYNDGALKVIGDISLNSANNLNPALNRWSLRARPSNIEGAFDVFDARFALSRLLIDSTGNVGIGTTSPPRRLTVSRLDTVNLNTVTNANQSVIRLNNPTSTIGAYTGIQFGFNTLAQDAQVHASIGVIQDSTSSSWGGRLAFANKADTSNGVLTEYMSIITGGNVGIGNTSPAFKLDVSGEGNFSSYLNVNGSAGIRSAGWIHLHRYSSNTQVAIGNNGTNINLIVPNGNVGIGNDTPASKLEVTGNVSIGYTNAAPANGMIVAGNVGIGTTNPTFKLDVTGTGRFTSTVTAPTFSGALSGNASTATTLQTARTLTIGSTGKTFNGSANVAWSLAEIGAYAASNPSQFLSQPGVRASLSFTAGSGAYNNTTGVITIPTNTNQLTNGAGYITSSSSISGNAATATILQTARLIGGVSFNGSANINLPGVNIAGNQNTTGNASTATTATNLNRQVIAGNGLTGGGTLTADRTLTVGAGSGISVSSTAVAVDSTVVRTTGNQTIAGVKTFTSPIAITNALLSNQQNLDVDTGAKRLIAEIPTAVYDAAFFDFVIKKGGNLRAGTVFAVHDGTAVEFTETSTNDIGTTAEVVLSCDVVGGNIRLLAETITNDWEIKTLVRGI
jgi:hypothetical protein